MPSCHKAFVLNNIEELREVPKYSLRRIALGEIAQDLSGDRAIPVILVRKLQEHRLYFRFPLCASHTSPLVFLSDLDKVATGVI